MTAHPDSGRGPMKPPAHAAKSARKKKRGGGGGCVGGGAGGGGGRAGGRGEFRCQRPRKGRRARARDAASRRIAGVGGGGGGGHVVDTIDEIGVGRRAPRGRSVRRLPRSGRSRCRFVVWGGGGGGGGGACRCLWIPRGVLGGGGGGGGGGGRGGFAHPTPLNPKTPAARPATLRVRIQRFRWQRGGGGGGAQCSPVPQRSQLHIGGGGGPQIAPGVATFKPGGNVGGSTGGGGGGSESHH